MVVFPESILVCLQYRAVVVGGLVVVVVGGGVVVVGGRVVVGQSFSSTPVLQSL